MLGGRGINVKNAQNPFADRVRLQRIPTLASHLHRLPSLTDGPLDTGERPFVCYEPGCLRTFSVQSNMKRHAKTHHLETNVSSGFLPPQGPLNRVPHSHVHPPPANEHSAHHHDMRICGDHRAAGNEDELEEDGEDVSGGEEGEEEEDAEEEDEG